MADYGTIEIRGVYSKSSDYSEPKIKLEPTPFSVSCDEFIKMTVQAEISVGTRIDTTIFDSISFLMVKNLSTTLNLQVTIGNATHTDPSAGTGFVTLVSPLGVFITTDVLPAAKVNVGETAGSGDGVMMCEVFIAGS